MKSFVSSLVNNLKSHYEVVFTKYRREGDKFIAVVERQMFENGAFEEAQDSYYSFVVSCAASNIEFAKVELIKGKKVIGTEIFGDVNTAKKHLKAA